MDSYHIVPEKCEYIDQQTLRVQELPENIPTGEMPRRFVVTCDRHLADRVAPGNRVILMGVFSIFNKTGTNQRSGKQIQGPVKQSYIRALGIQSEHSHMGHSNASFALPNISQDDEEGILRMSRDPLIYHKICKSVASAIYGNDDIKKAVACLLFGGTPKRLPDGMKLRGDINVLLLGDPSTAKS